MRSLFAWKLALVLAVVGLWAGCSDGGGSSGDHDASNSDSDSDSDGDTDSDSDSDSDSDTDGDLPAECLVTSDFCTLWCCACMVCTELGIQEGDCLDNGGEICMSLCVQTLEGADSECLDAAEEYVDDLKAVIDDPDNWLTCDSTVDNNHPFDEGSCPELNP